MRANVVVVFGATLMLCGCAGIDYVNIVYGRIPVREFAMKGGDTYRVFDKPEDRKLLITGSLSRMAGPNSGAGWFGPANPEAAGTRAEFESAAIAYLVDTGRTCTLRGAGSPVRGQWEFNYDCAQIKRR